MGNDGAESRGRLRGWRGGDPDRELEVRTDLTQACLMQRGGERRENSEVTLRFHCDEKLKRDSWEK